MTKRDQLEPLIRAVLAKANRPESDRMRQHRKRMELEQPKRRRA